MTNCLPGMGKDIKTLLREMQARTMRGNPDFYKPFPEADSWALRKHHREQAQKFGLDKSKPLLSRSGVKISIGYNRIVIGDYGAYIEIKPDQMVMENIISRFNSAAPNRPVKYIWMTTTARDAKIYHQQATVKYADYVPGMYYVAPDEVFQVEVKG